MVVDPKELTIIGATNFRSMRKKFGIKRDDRRRHVYVIGKSGSGKSALLENMIMQDILNGNGCCVMDPHGDLAEAIVKCIPPERQNDVVYFNPSDVEHPVAFNILEGAGSDSSKNLVTSGLIGIFKKIWADSWGPRLEYVLRNTILSLMYAEGSTLLGINRMLTDKKYRNSVLENVHDPILKAFWTQEYENYPAKELPMIVSPIQNKVGQFLSNPIVRNILGQAHSTMDLREIMDKKKIFLVNLSKGRIGEDNSSLIGSMIVTKLYLAAMSRVDLPEEQRNDFYLYVDEFQNFATDSFADILSEARKYRLSLIVAHQYVLQLPEKVSDAIFGNGGTLITFRLGSQDAEIFEKEFGPDFTLEDLVNIPKYNIVLKLLIDGVASRPFSAATLPPMTKSSEYEDRSAAIIAESRKKYSRSKEYVEEQIREWSLTEDEKRSIEKKNKEEKTKKENQEKGIVEEFSENKTYSTNCWICGMKMEVPFKPDDKRPIYCVDDLKKIREKLIPEPTENRFVKKVEKTPEEKAKINENTFANVFDNKKVENNNQNQQKNSQQQNNKNINNSNNQQKQDNRNQTQKPKQDNNQNNKQQVNQNTKNNTVKQDNRNQENKNNKNISNVNNIKENVVINKVEEVKKIESNNVIQNVIEPAQVIQKIEQPEVDFKSMLGDVMKETGINTEKLIIKNENKIDNKEDEKKPVINQNQVKIDVSSLIEEVTKNEPVKENIVLDKVEEAKKIESNNVIQNVIEPAQVIKKIEQPEIEILKIEESKDIKPKNIEQSTSNISIEQNSISEDVKEDIVPQIQSKPTLSLNQLKEKSFDEIKEELNQKKNNNQSNVLKAGEVIKL
ncbi:MAG: type IV secretion system DNA-binding domain-containing protein [Patescibacteria group bacterium]